MENYSNLSKEELLKVIENLTSRLERSSIIADTQGKMIEVYKQNCEDKDIIISKQERKIDYYRSVLGNIFGASKEALDKIIE